VPTCQPPLTDPPGGMGHMHPKCQCRQHHHCWWEQPHLVTQGQALRKSRPLVLPLSLLSLALEPAQKMSLMSKVHEPACQPSPSDSRESSGLLAPTPVGHGAQTSTCAMTYHSSLHRPPLHSPTGWWGRSLTYTLLQVGESATLVACHDLGLHHVRCPRIC
jgi:hypothetical protein